MNQLSELTATELALRVRRREVSPLESVGACLERIEALNPLLNAFVHIDADAALEAARAQEARLAAGQDPGPLAGCALGVKDLEDVAGMPTTFGSVPFRDNLATRSSVQVQRLVGAGAIVVGKTNTPEFGCTALTHNRVFGTTLNPWRLERTPGGSSGGSAAAIAARMVPLVTASDGGGSVRIPACYVGAFGFKPTFGRIPIGAEEALGMQRWVDTVHYGPLSRCVADAAVFLDVASGYHPCDPTSLPKAQLSYAATLEDIPERLRIGFSRDLGYAMVESEVLRQVEAAAAVFARLGHQVEEVDLALPDLGRGWAYMCGAESYAELSREVEGRESELGRGFWSGLEAAATLDVATTGEFQRQRARLNEALWNFFEAYDLLLTPTLPTEAFAAKGPLPSQVDGGQFTSPLHAVAFSYPFNFSGHPAATVRAGLTGAGLPCGLQIIAERHRDQLVLQAARAYESERPFSEWPSL